MNAKISNQLKDIKKTEDKVQEIFMTLLQI